MWRQRGCWMRSRRSKNDPAQETAMEQPAMDHARRALLNIIAVLLVVIAAVIVKRLSLLWSCNDYALERQRIAKHRLELILIGNSPDQFRSNSEGGS